MPKPMADETEEKYISRCMGDEHMAEKYPDNDQRVAVCYTYWDKKDAPDNPEHYSRRTVFHGDHDQSDHGNRDGGGSSGESKSGPSTVKELRTAINDALETYMEKDADNGGIYSSQYDRVSERLLSSGALETALQDGLDPEQLVEEAIEQDAIENDPERSLNEQDYDKYIKKELGDMFRKGKIPRAEYNAVKAKVSEYAKSSAKQPLGRRPAWEWVLDDMLEQAAIEGFARVKRDRKFARMTDVELFAAGTWNGLPFTESDLDGIVSAFDALNLSGRVPLKLGHDGPDARRDPLTQLAMGWVQSVRRVGDKLLGTIEVPDKVRGLFKDGYLKFVSIELLKDVKASTRKIPWVLDAVALLGTDQPAVGILGDLQSVTMARSELEFESCVSFARDDMRPFHSINGDTSDMSNDKTALQELSDKLLALSAQVNDLQSENRQLKNRDAEFAQTKARFERLQEENKRRDIQTHRDKVTGRIEAAVKSEDITPAARERFNKVYRVDDDGAVMTISIEDVEEFVRENPNPHKKKARKHAFTSLSSPDADIPVDVPVDVEASMRVEAFLRQSGVKNPTDRDIQAAAVQMFKSNPELGARYKAAADAQYGK